MIRRTGRRPAKRARPQPSDVTLRWVFVEQYGIWFKLTPRQWWSLVRDAVTPDGYELPASSALSRRSPLVGEAWPDGREAPSVVWPKDDRDRCFDGIINWTDEAWNEAARDLVALGYPDPRLAMPRDRALGGVAPAGDARP